MEMNAGLERTSSNHASTTVTMMELMTTPLALRMILVKKTR